jgi:hypothetical protein
MTQIEKEELTYEQFMYRAHRVPLAPKCAKCGSIKNLERHHEQYENPEIFITLCKTCHSRAPKIENPLEEEWASMSLDSETARKLKRIAELAHMSQTEILREFVSEVYKVIDGSKCERISLMSYELKEKSAVLTRVGKLFVGQSKEFDEKVLE